MKFTSLALVASMAINGVANAESDCAPCNGVCSVRGDPHVTSFAGKTYKLDPSGKWNNLYTSGRSQVTAKISGSKEGEYITELRIGGKVITAKSLCSEAGEKHTEMQLQGAKVTINCAKPKVGQCDKVDCSLWHLDVLIKKTDMSKDAQKKETGACTFGCDCGNKPSPSPSPSPSGDDCKDLVMSLCGKAPKGCNMFGGNDRKSKCDSYDKCLNKNSKNLNNKKHQCLPKPGPSPSPSPGPSPGPQNNCKSVVTEKCGKAPKGCKIFGDNKNKDKCASYDKCVDRHDKYYDQLVKLNCLPNPSPSPSPSPKPSGETCTCTARCTAYGDPHVKSFANEQYKTSTGGEKNINMYSLGKFSATAHVSDHMSKEYMTEFYHNKKEIISTKKCKDNESVKFNEELKDGSMVFGQVTCRTNPQGFRYLNVRLAKQFSVDADSGVMSAGAGNMSFEAMKKTIGGSGECMFADKKAPKTSNIVCKC